MLGYLGAGNADAPQRGDHLDRVLIGAIGDHPGRRRAIEQPRRALEP
jgi:hypothetical protein